MKNILMCILVSFSSGFTSLTLSQKEIGDIYSTYIEKVHTEEYKNRYHKLPMELNRKKWRWEGKDVMRVIALLEFNRFVKENNIFSEKALCFARSDPEFEYIKTNKIYEYQYTLDVIKHDLHSLNIPEKDFDFVMCNQTLEHVYDPITCLKNIYKVMRSGGILYINVPANNIPHSTPFHFFTGYTSMGLATTIKLAGFELLNIGQWGNKEYMYKMFQSNGWPDYSSLRNYYNDPTCPLITWAFAIKP